jgi:hypothetical protein
MHTISSEKKKKKKKKKNEEEEKEESSIKLTKVEFTTRQFFGNAVVSFRSFFFLLISVEHLTLPIDDYEGCIPFVHSQPFDSEVTNFELIFICIINK